MGWPGSIPSNRAFVDHTAFQCSFCTPGFVLATRALLTEEPHPTEERIREALAGNLCRCGSYIKIVDAVLDAADRLDPAPVWISNGTLRRRPSYMRQYTTSIMSAVACRFD